MIEGSALKEFCTLSSFNEQFLLAIIIIAIGYILKKFNIITEQDGEGLSRIIFNITLPALIIVSFTDITIEPSLFLLIIFGFVYGLMMAFLGIYLFRKADQSIRGMQTMLISGFNVGLFAYPLVGGIWGKQGIQYFGMFDVGNAMIIFGVVYLIGSYYSTEDAELKIGVILKKLSRSIPLMTYVIVCILAIIGFKLPSFIIDVSEVISVANMPLSFLLLGIYLSFSLDKVYVRKVIHVLSLRYVIGLVVGIALFFILPLNEMFKYTILLGLILPIPLSALPYAVEFDYDRKFVGTVSNLTILISFGLLWGIANIFL